MPAPTLRHGARRVDLADLMRLLALIDSAPQTRRSELCELLGVSRATMNRILEHTRVVAEVAVVWDPSGQEYRVEDWGVLDRERVYDWMRRHYPGEARASFEPEGAAK